MANKVAQLLGVAMRANKLVSGESLVLKEIRSRKAHLVILAIDAAPNVEKNVTDKCKTYKVSMIRYGLRHELGKAIGKAERVVLAITDQGLAKLVRTSGGDVIG